MDKKRIENLEYDRIYSLEIYKKIIDDLLNTCSNLTKQIHKENLSLLEISKSHEFYSDNIKGLLQTAERHLQIALDCQHDLDLIKILTNENKPKEE